MMASAPTPDTTLTGPEDDEADVAVVGGGAAGLMTAIWTARAAAEAGAPSVRVVVLDGARKLGAKILIAGGGRCNVTHHAVSEADYAGSTRPAIRKVLRRFDVPATIRFFDEIGVPLVREEETGKLFPETNSARTVLDALVRTAREAGVEIRCARRVDRIDRLDSGAQGAPDATSAREPRFTVCGSTVASREQAASSEVPSPVPLLRARTVVLATGGQSVPKTGSDGSGFRLARSLGHTLTPRIFPALVPLLLPEGHPVRSLAGIAVPVRLTLSRRSGKPLATFSGALLCTHFGVSGPVVLDISRYYLDAAEDGDAVLAVDWLPEAAATSLDEALQGLGKKSVLRWLSTELPERLARMLLVEAGAAPAVTGAQLSRAVRQDLLRAIKTYVLPVQGSRGFRVAEATAGGVPLREVRLESMESRIVSGTYLAGEVLDVDGRIGGFNFQWAWASGWVAGQALGRLPARSKAM